MKHATKVRYVILGLTVAVAVLLYVDRFCLSTTDREIKRTLGLSEDEMAMILSIFFLPYAIGQLPFGYLADRFGARRMLSIYMVIWSTLTAFMGMAGGYTELLIYRFGMGLFESGAYPACAGIIKRWVPTPMRGLASGIVSLGGRLGGTITPKLTTLLMAVFAGVLPQFASWRPVFVLYGLFGLGLAAIFWFLHRDRPEEHPWVNREEVDLIKEWTQPLGSSQGDDGIQAAASPRAKAPAGLAQIPWSHLLSHSSIWLNCFIQFGINFGWAFLLTYLNRYLLEVHNADLQTRGWMSTFVVFLSLPSLIFGGLLTDYLTTRIGKRWGRALPLAIPRLIAAGLYFVVAFLSLSMPAEPTVRFTWTIVTLLGLIAFFSDLTLPAIWAFNLDVGGRNVGFVLGWGNMWGNLGAFLSPLVLNQLVGEWGWNSVFWTCGSVFFIIGIASVFIDSRRPLPD